MGVDINQFIQQFSKVPENVEIYQVCHRRVLFYNVDIIQDQKALYFMQFMNVIVYIDNYKNRYLLKYQSYFIS